MSESGRNSGLLWVAVAVVLGGAGAGAAWYLNQSAPPADVTPLTQAAVPVAQPQEDPPEADAAQAPVSQDPSEVAAGVTEEPRIEEVRVEADGLAVMAGTARPGSEVVLRLDGVEVARATADAAGAFATVAFLDPSADARVLTVFERTEDGQERASSEDLILAPVRVASLPEDSAPDRGDSNSAEATADAAQTAGDVDLSNAPESDQSARDAAPTSQVLAQEDVTQEDVTQEDMAQEDSAEVETANPPVSQVEPQQDAAQEDSAGVETSDPPAPPVEVQQDPAQDDVAQEDPAEVETVQLPTPEGAAADDAQGADDTAEEVAKLPARGPDLASVKEPTLSPPDASAPIEEDRPTVSAQVGPAVEKAVEALAEPASDTAPRVTAATPAVPDPAPTTNSAELAERQEVLNPPLTAPLVTAPPQPDPLRSSVSPESIVGPVRTAQGRILSPAKAEDETPNPQLGEDVAVLDAATTSQAQASRAPQERGSARPVAAAPSAPEVPAAEETQQIAVIKSNKDGVRVVQPITPSADELRQIALDTISYSAEGAVQLAGRAQTSAQEVRVYLDNQPIAVLGVDKAGDWRAELPDIDSGVYTLRLDELDEGGKVTSRVETPFKREEPEVLAAALGDSDASVKAITVQKGNTLWAIARERYGQGVLYVRVFEANRDSIRNPDLIYPGQVFSLPEK